MTLIGPGLATGQQVQVGRWGGEQVPGVQRAAVGDPVAFQEGSGARQHPGLVDQDAAGARAARGTAARA